MYEQNFLKRLSFENKYNEKSARFSKKLYFKGTDLMISLFSIFFLAVILIAFDFLLTFLKNKEYLILF